MFYDRKIPEETAKIIRDAADADLAWYAFSTAQESFPAVLDPEQFFSILPYEETVIEIAATKEELRQLESYPETPELRKQIEDLESELVSEYESLEDYKGRIQLYESEFYEY